MRQTAVKLEAKSERVVKDIRRKTRKQHSAEEKIRILLEGLRGEDHPLIEITKKDGSGVVKGNAPDNHAAARLFLFGGAVLLKHSVAPS